MMRISGRRGAIALLAFVSLVVAAAPCQATAPDSPPSWVLETPASDATYTWFVGWADGSPESEGDAAVSATSSLIAQILRYMGATVSASTTATARAGLDRFEADLTQTVRQSSTSRVAGFEIRERYVARKKTGITVYILGRYATKELEAEKQRIAALFQEKLDAVAIPEARGRDLLAAGDAVDAAKAFIEAACAASSSDVENAAIKFERNLNQARGALSSLSVEKLNDTLEGTPGSPFSSPFKARVLFQGKALPGVTLTVGYQVMLPNGRLSTRTASIQTDGEGLASFDHPAPNFVGKATLSMRLDLSDALLPLSGASSAFTSQIAGLEDLIASKAVRFDYRVISRARTVPTVVCFMDIDASGKADFGTSSSAFLQVLSRNGFSVTAASIAPSKIVGLSDSEVLDLSRLIPKAERFAWGVSRIVSVKDEGGQKIATVRSEFRVVEVASGSILYSASRQASSVSSTEEAAVDGARRQLARNIFAEEVMAQLP